MTHASHRLFPAATLRLAAWALAIAGLVCLPACDRQEPGAGKQAPGASATQPSAQPAAQRPGESASAAKGAPASTAPATGPADAASVDRTGWPPVIRMGLVPVEGGADTRERNAPLRDILEQELGRPVELVSASSYQGVITAMANNQLEFAFFGPKSYVEAAKRAGAEALLVELNVDNEPGYRCVFIVPAASPVKTLKEAKGLRFAFTDPNSTSGCLIPSMIVFDETGQSAETFFGKVAFSGAHATSMLQVAAGEIDIAATNDLDLNKITSKGTVRSEDLRVVYRSDMIPGAPMAGRRDLPASLKQAFAKALMKLNADRAVLERLQNGGFEPVTDQAYDVIRATQDFLDKKKTEAKPNG